MKNEIKNAELTDEELEGIVGGKVQWDALTRYFLMTAPTLPDVVDLIDVVKDKDWDKAVIIASKIFESNPEKFAAGKNIFNKLGVLSLSKNSIPF